MQDDRFEWDDDKAVSNEARHNVTFEMARMVFDDLFGIELPDDNKDRDEDRYRLIGVADGRTLLVVYTMRGDRIRIISARLAKPYERRKYHEENE